MANAKEEANAKAKEAKRLAREQAAKEKREKETAEKITESKLSNEAADLYADAVEGKSSLTLVPVKKLKKNHTVTAVLVKDEQVVVDGMVVVRTK
jgi:hypothetical protein